MGTLTVAVVIIAGVLVMQKRNGKRYYRANSRNDLGGRVGDR